MGKQEAILEGDDRNFTINFGPQHMKANVVTRIKGVILLLIGVGFVACSDKSTTDTPASDEADVTTDDGSQSEPEPSSGVSAEDLIAHVAKSLENEENTTLVDCLLVMDVYKRKLLTVSPDEARGAEMERLFWERAVKERLDSTGLSSEDLMAEGIFRKAVSSGSLTEREIEEMAGSTLRSCAAITKDSVAAFWAQNGEGVSQPSAEETHKKEMSSKTNVETPR